LLYETDNERYLGPFEGFKNPDTLSRKGEWFVAGAEIYKDVGD